MPLLLLFSDNDGYLRPSSSSRSIERNQFAVCIFVKCGKLKKRLTENVYTPFLEWSQEALLEFSRFCAAWRGPLQRRYSLLPVRDESCPQVAKNDANMATQSKGHFCMLLPIVKVPCPHVPPTKTREEKHFRKPPFLKRQARGRKPTSVFPVHGQDVVEVIEVWRTDRSGDGHQLHSTSESSSPHPGICWVPLHTQVNSFHPYPHSKTSNSDKLILMTIDGFSKDTDNTWTISAPNNKNWEDKRHTFRAHLMIIDCSSRIDLELALQSSFLYRIYENCLSCWTPAYVAWKTCPRPQGRPHHAISTGTVSFLHMQMLTLQLQLKFCSQR